MMRLLLRLLGASHSATLLAWVLSDGGWGSDPQTAAPNSPSACPTCSLRLLHLLQGLLYYFSHKDSLINRLTGPCKQTPQNTVALLTSTIKLEDEEGLMRCVPSLSLPPSLLPPLPQHPSHKSFCSQPSRHSPTHSHHSLPFSPLVPSFPFARFCFRLISPEGTFTLQAKSDGERQQWVDTIQVKRKKRIGRGEEGEGGWGEERKERRDRWMEEPEDLRRVVNGRRGQKSPIASLTIHTAPTLPCSLA
jgi:hypothetical protein